MVRKALLAEERPRYAALAWTGPGLDGWDIGWHRWEKTSGERKLTFESIHVLNAIALDMETAT